ncbi:MAG: carboxylesterase/lipase family protein, partial [Myxococcota bacterium]
FLGIPFAKPPVGELRFRAPEPPDPWSGVLEASGFRRSAPQGESALPGMSVGETSEDCLYLNVFSPQAGTGARPVLFWVHGGGFTAGSASQDLYDGGPLATRGDVVVVTINYRLGALGYLSLDGVDSNIGQRDQIAALEWVRDNIESFGGDPENVTIFGESAGGMAVTALLAMPAARGLFHRAISQSGTTHQGYGSDSADIVASMLLEELGVSDVAGLRSASVESLVEAQLRCMAKTRREIMQMPFVPVIDAESMPRHPLDAVAAGTACDIPLLVGTNLDEFKLFALGDRKITGMGNESLEKRVRSLTAAYRGDDSAAAKLLETYRHALEQRGPNSPYEILSAIESDRSFRVPGIRIAEAQCIHQPQTFSYLLTWKSPAARGLLGACHALELPFVFGTLGAPTMDRFAGTGADADLLSETMMDSWLAFARSGDPGCDALPNWDGYDAGRRATMLFDRDCELVDAPYDTERAAWDQIF